MLQNLYPPEPLELGPALSMLHDAWLVEDEYLVRVHAACIRRVLLLDVEPLAECGSRGAYRSPAAAARRVVVDTVDRLRPRYLADTDLSALGWTAGEPPVWFEARVTACRAREKLAGARIVGWAEDEVAEISWGRADAKRPTQLTFVGMHPVRSLGGERLGRFGRLLSLVAS
jgi:hypothetical protein